LSFYLKKRQETSEIVALFFIQIATVEALIMIRKKKGNLSKGSEIAIPPTISKRSFPSLSSTKQEHLLIQILPEFPKKTLLIGIYPYNVYINS